MTLEELLEGIPEGTRPHKQVIEFSENPLRGRRSGPAIAQAILVVAADIAGGIVFEDACSPYPHHPILKDKQ